jgi:hypothetical protein
LVWVKVLLSPLKSLIYTGHLLALQGAAVTAILHDQKKCGQWDGNLVFVLAAMKFGIDVVSFGIASPNTEFFSAVCFLKTFCLDLYEVGHVTQTAFALYHILGHPMDTISRDNNGNERRNHFCLLVAKTGDQVMLDKDNSVPINGCQLMQSITINSDVECSDADDDVSLEEWQVGPHAKCLHSTTVKLVCI